MSCGGAENVNEGYIDPTSLWPQGSSAAGTTLGNWTQQVKTWINPATGTPVSVPISAPIAPASTLTYLQQLQQLQQLQNQYIPASSYAVASASAAAKEKIKWYTWLVVSVVLAMLAAIVIIVTMRLR